MEAKVQRPQLGEGLQGLKAGQVINNPQTQLGDGTEALSQVA